MKNFIFGLVLLVWFDCAFLVVKDNDFKIVRSRVRENEKISQFELTS